MGSQGSQGAGGGGGGAFDASSWHYLDRDLDKDKPSRAAPPVHACLRSRALDAHVLPTCSAAMMRTTHAVHTEGIC